MVGDVSELVDAPLGEVGLVILSHLKRNCLYDVTESYIELGISDEATVRDQMERYHERRVPEQ